MKRYIGERIVYVFVMFFLIYIENGIIFNLL